ncbi:GPI biosynthesis protein family Pig-F-domain-containing protein [Mycena metata]|uniref:GPI biosynthesis protein family Pig-F-domain-containing protein n=1 Tax=Mycena metata TaxID=1033252 RepID=A0AAD7HHC4_9AGAR|nr:GPI biosynthesis protein family Pig-F-domain-containing protein [Mycena metata]
MAKKSKAAKAAAAESSSLNSTSNAKPSQKSSPSTSSGSGSAAKTKQLEQEVPPPPPTFFPFASYTATVGVHTTLLVFTALFLPQAVTPTLHELFESSSSSQRSGDAQGRTQAQQTSLDRPQHPFLDALTLDPVATLICVCVGAALLQGWWGGWVRGWGVDYALRRSEYALQGGRPRGEMNKKEEKDAEVERRVERANVDGRKFANLLNAWLVTGAFALLFYAVLILFGAPLLSHIAHTALLAVLLAVLTAFPASYALGSPTSSETTRFTWLRLFAEFDPHTPLERALLYPAVGALVGAWAGAVPMALDWDRAWQTYPLPPLFGAVAGYVLASLGALTVSGVRFFAEEDMRMRREAAASGR